MGLRYHQATFDLLRKRPRPSKRAVAALDRRERVLGITLPDSLREFYAVQGVCAILTEPSNDDEAVPIERLGDPQGVSTNSSRTPWFAAHPRARRKVAA